MGVAKTSLTVDFADSSDSSLFIEYRADDNKLPSEIYEEQKDSGECSVDTQLVSPLTQEELAAELCYQDLQAWPKRKLRVYPAVLPTLKTSHGTIYNGAVASSTETEVLKFNGGRQASLQYPASSIEILESTLWTPEGDNTYPNLTFDGNRTIRTTEDVHGYAVVKYTAPYRIVHLDVPGNLGEKTVMVLATYQNQASSTDVQFTPKVCAFSGVVVGQGCNESRESIRIRIRTRWPTVRDTFNNEWVEISREEDTINVSGVEIARITKVTFEVPGGNEVTLVFTNP